MAHPLCRRLQTPHGPAPCACGCSRRASGSSGLAAAGLPRALQFSASACRILPVRNRGQETPRLLTQKGLSRPSSGGLPGGQAVDDDPLEVFELMPDRSVMHQRSLGTRTAEAALLGGPQVARLRLENLTIQRSVRRPGRLSAMGSLTEADPLYKFHIQGVCSLKPQCLADFSPYLHQLITAQVKV